MINILEPDLTKKEISLVNNTLKKKHISSFGNLPILVKKKISSMSGCNNVTLTSSGSAALILGLKSLNLNKEDLVITTNYTFIASINSIIHTGHKPWIFDVSKKDLSIDLNHIEKILESETFKRGKYYYHKKLKKRISCIMPVFFCGLIPDLKKLSKISKKFNLKIISDCAGAFFSIIENKDIIKTSDIVITSFNGNKTITAGSGGALFSKNKKIYNKFNSLVDNSKYKHKYTHDDFGFNFKISSLHAAVLLGQLNRFFEIKKKKKFITDFYSKNLISKKFDFINSKDMLWVNLIKFKNLQDKYLFISKTNKHKIKFEEFWVTMNNQKKLKSQMFFNSYKISDNISKKVVAIPSSSTLKIKDLKLIVKTLTKF